jgi:hypothetical protein
LEVKTMMIRTDPFQVFDQLNRQLTGHWARPNVMAMAAYRSGDEAADPGRGAGQAPEDRDQRHRSRGDQRLTPLRLAPGST